MDFSGKAVVVTGASSGIGLETALAFSKMNARICLVARGKKKLSLAEKECAAAGAQKTLALACDVADYAQVKKACAAIKKGFGKVDVLVNNAGYGVYGAFQDSKIGDIKGMMRTNYFGTVYFTKEILPTMEGGSHIVNVGSMAGKLALTNYAGYCASKFAVSAFTESIRHELMKDGIAVHLICPTATKTHFFDNKSFAGHPHNENRGGMDEPSRIARWIVNSIERNVPETTSQRPKEKLALFLRANFPGIYGRIMQSRYVKRQLEKEGG